MSPSAQNSKKWASFRETLPPKSPITARSEPVEGDSSSQVTHYSQKWASWRRLFLPSHPLQPEVSKLRETLPPKSPTTARSEPVEGDSSSQVTHYSQKWASWGRLFLPSHPLKPEVSQLRETLLPKSPTTARSEPVEGDSSSRVTHYSQKWASWGRLFLPSHPLQPEVSQLT